MNVTAGLGCADSELDLLILVIENISTYVTVFKFALLCFKFALLSLRLQSFIAFPT